MPLGTITVTGKTGAAQQLTSRALINLSEVSFDLVNGVLRLYHGGGRGDGQLKYDVGLDSVTTVTCTVTAGVFAFTVS